MGIVELIIVVFLGALPTGVLSAVAWKVGKETASATTTVERPPLPVVATVGAAAFMLLGAAIGMAVGHPFMTKVLLALATEPLIIHGPGDVSIATIYATALTLTWLALPGASATLYLVLSRSRSTRAAVLLGLLVALGFSAGVAVCIPVVETLLAPRSPASSLPQAQFSMLSLVSSAVRAMLGLGIAGALCGASSVALAAAPPTAHPNRMLLLSIAPIPFLALLIAALTTPPDLATQVFMAAAIALGWGAGLFVGTLVHRARRKRDAPSISTF